jgi:biotin transport system substrate-specific component
LIGLSVKYLKHFNKFNFVTLFIAIIIFGVIFIDVSGAVGLTLITHMSFSKALLMQLTFIPGDLIKAALATTIALTLRRRFSVLEHD